MFKITENKKKTSKLLAECKALFPVWSYNSDEELDKQFPPPEEITTRYFRDSVEPDSEHLGKSAEDCEKEGIKGITLRERIMMELQYFKETGQHLDIKCWTRCTGSRNADGDVPSSDWYGDKFKVSFGDAGDQHPNAGPREAFDSPNPSATPQSLRLGTQCPHCKELVIITLSKQGE